MTRSSRGVVFIRHGILSGSSKMSGLEKSLAKVLPNWKILNKDYIWRDSVLLSGALFAQEVLSEWEDSGRILLVGHSQGGLVARVAAVVLCATAKLELLLSSDEVEPDYAEGPLRVIEQIRKSEENRLDNCQRALAGVVMLATPNSGAFTFGQLSISGKLLASAATQLLRFRWKNILDLQTDRLFRLLQQIDIEDVNYLSVSGSRVNRFSRLHHSDVAALPPLSRLAPSLDLPNDLVVEDASVDLNQAPLPTEIKDLNSQYRHIRLYRDCLDVSHSGIHQNRHVIEIISEHFASWGL